MFAGSKEHLFSAFKTKCPFSIVLFFFASGVPVFFQISNEDNLLMDVEMIFCSNVLNFF